MLKISILVDICDGLGVYWHVEDMCDYSIDFLLYLLFLGLKE